MTDVDNAAFYDELAWYYDLIFADWSASMRRQGESIRALIARYLPECADSGSILDAAAGIGTQSLPLAQLGYRVLSRDLSPTSIARLRQEAVQRSVQIDAAVSDMRTVHLSIEGQVDAVLAFDNAVPHLQNDAAILEAFRAFHAALRPGGVCVISVRDYANVPRDADTVHPYGVKWRDGVRYLPLQAWHWIDSEHYETTFYVVADHPGEASVLRSTARYYAIAIPRVLELLEIAGFYDCEQLDDVFYQPVLVGRHR